ncbi:FAD-binding oxidoreductase, partial [Mesorhizobium sp. M2D.F.Ca.ET.145.01.1.1]
GIGKSYYVATANPAPDHPALAGDVEADLVVVGGGCTGLSAALHAAERGLKVVLLEGGKIGWGASGRNGGQMIPGLRKGAKGLVKLYGPERAKVLFDLAFEARGLVLGIIERHAIDCDLRLTGHLVGAVNGSDLRDLEEEAKCLESVMKFPDVEILSAADARAKVDTPYHGAMYEPLGGHMHPLNYTLGLARAAV